MDIEVVAGHNTATWRARAQVLIDSDLRLENFHAATAVSLCGTNVDAHKLGFFLRQRPRAVVSALRVREADEGRDQAWRSIYISSSWGARRLAVEQELDSVGAVIYGTVDLPECVGADNYGIYRVVVDPEAGRDVTVLPHNSASGYAPQGVIDKTGLERDAAEWGARSDVLTVTHGSRALSRSPSEWPSLLAEISTDTDVEQDLTEVLIRRSEYELTPSSTVRVDREVLAAALSPLLTILSSNGISGSIDECTLVAKELTDAADLGEIDLVIIGADS